MLETQRCFHTLVSRSTRARTVATLLLLPLLWGALTSHASLCESGLRQSPIDIKQSQRQALPPLQFSYQTTPLRVANDGHTLRVRFKPGSVLQIGAQTYTLHQFHFHTPGGDRIAGEEFPMVAHLLHKSPSGQLLALAVLFRTGSQDYPLFNTLLPIVPAKPDGDHVYQDITVSASALLPTHRGYYRYSGSLTSAPCTEGVDWIVMKQALEISAKQLSLYKTTFANNARDVQPLHQRHVLESTSK